MKYFDYKRNIFADNEICAIKIWLDKKNLEETLLINYKKNLKTVLIYTQYLNEDNISKF